MVGAVGVVGLDEPCTHCTPLHMQVGLRLHCDRCEFKSPTRCIEQVGSTVGPVGADGGKLGIEGGAGAGTVGRELGALVFFLLARNRRTARVGKGSRKSPTTTRSNNTRCFIILAFFLCQLCRRPRLRVSTAVVECHKIGADAPLTEGDWFD